ncbi:gamma-glutamylcyclotransferase isoform X2 [Anabrus simplex]|uniref:gamma-glutamylcyclotransferase isoform X2 n=1 Tax=Anabrus simplex TaxID=316456 RepID=UPI0035A38148
MGMRSYPVCQIFCVTSIFYSFAQSGQLHTICENRMTKNAPTANDKFLYFAYGSNLLAQRIHINNPTAKRIATGKLKDYRLDFNFWSPGWKGCVATIVPQEGSVTWGAVWEIDISNLPNLDRQELVHKGVYFPLQVTIETTDHEKLSCRTYQLYDIPPPLKEYQELPEERRPSKTYLKVIIEGAKESCLPESYISSLELIPDNGQESNFPFKTYLPSYPFITRYG